MHDLGGEQPEDAESDKCKPHANAPQPCARDQVTQPPERHKHADHRGVARVLSLIFTLLRANPAQHIAVWWKYNMWAAAGLVVV